MATTEMDIVRRSRDADVATILEILPPGPRARDRAEDLLWESGWSVSAALERFFSSPTAVAGEGSSTSSAAATVNAAVMDGPSSAPKVSPPRQRSSLKSPPSLLVSRYRRSDAYGDAQGRVEPGGRPTKRPRAAAATEAAVPSAPLAERVRPASLSDLIGQPALSEKSALGRLLQEDRLPSCVLWGPPGCGKTTVAGILGRTTAARFIRLSAVEAGVKQVRSVVEGALGRRKIGQGRTVLFLDEIHRWNKSQQDALLPHVESGLVTLVGATTENPSFSLNRALLSRCRVIVMDKLGTESLTSILRAALTDPRAGLPRRVEVSDDVLKGLSNLADGDARTAINALEIAINVSSGDPASEGGTSDAAASESSAVTTVTAEAVRVAYQKTHLPYDRDGEDHYNAISALHKSMRGGSVDASLYWLARMLESGEDPLYITRRLVRFASEDIGLADPQALLQAAAARDAAERIGMPECEVILAQVVVYLALAPKSVAVYRAYGRAKELVRGRTADPVPLHLRNAPTGLMKEIGYGKEYEYPPDNGYRRGHSAGFLPETLKDSELWHPDDVEPGNLLHFDKSKQYKE